MYSQKHSLSSSSRSSSCSSVASDEGSAGWGTGGSRTHGCSAGNGGVGKDVRIAVVGQGGVGKSALIVRFMTGRFLHKYNPTLEDKYSKTMRVEGDCYRLSILDTAGEDDRHIIYYFSYSHVILLLFSLNDRSSFLKAQQIRQKADAHWHGSRTISTILVGCKGDTTRKVTTSEALSVAKQLDCCYVETSAAEGYNCALPFKTAIKMYSHQFTERSDLLDSGDHTPNNRYSKGIIRKLLSPMSSGKRDSRDSSPSTGMRLPAARMSDHLVHSPSLKEHPPLGHTPSHTPQTPEPITITVSMEG